MLKSIKNKLVWYVIANDSKSLFKYYNYLIRQFSRFNTNCFLSR